MHQFPQVLGADENFFFKKINSGLFHFGRAAFSLHLRTKVGSTLVKSADLRVNLNLDGDPITSRTYSPITLTNISSINLVSIFRCSSPPRNTVYSRRVDPSSLDFRISLYRQSYIGLLYNSRFESFYPFIINNSNFHSRFIDL
jgi:hypothetical protein